MRACGMKREEKVEPSFPLVLLLSGVALAAVFLYFYFATREPRPKAIHEDRSLTWSGHEEPAYPFRMKQPPVTYIPAHQLDTVVVDRPAYALTRAPDREQVLVNLLEEPINDESPVLNRLPRSEYIPVDEVVNTTPPVRYQFSIGQVNGVDRTHKLDHFRLARRTGAGKSWAVARIMAQLLRQGVTVYYINPKYMPVDDAGVDLRPIIKRCTKVAIETDCKDGLLLLEEARTAMFRRIEDAREQCIASFTPLVVIVDELSALEIGWKELEEKKEIGFKSARKRGTNAIDLLLRWGRQPKVFYGTTSQDGQAQNGPTNTGTAGNFGISACHPSLDRFSLQNILGDVDSKKLPEITGPYQWWVQTANPTGLDEVVTVDVPAITNEWIGMMLKDVPIVPVEQQKVESCHSSVNGKKSNVLAETMLKRALEQAVPSGTPQQDTERAFRVEQTPAPMEQAVNEVIPTGVPEYVRATRYLVEYPGASQRELAAHLWGKSDGRWNGKAGQLMAEIRSMTRKDT